MSVWPVIVRELRSQARQPLTHWLRIIGGLSLVAAGAWALWTMGILKGKTQGTLGLSNTAQTFGTTLFGKLNLFIFVVIWLFVPLATADAVSRERREGTLALLYLTELRSLGIVVGKAFVHMLRSVSLFVTMAPWLMLPLIFGGVGLRDIGMALMLDFASVLLAQAAGLLASTIPRDWLKSVMLAQLFALILFLSLLHVHGVILTKAVRVGTPAAILPGTPTFWNSRFSVLQDFYGSGQMGVVARTRWLMEFTTNASTDQDYRWGRTAVLETKWHQLWTTLTPPGVAFWFRGVAGILLGAGLILLLAAWLGAWRVDRSWRDAPASLKMFELRRRFFSPRFGVQVLKRNLSRSLTANPIGWLEQYSPSARMVKWGWCLFIAVVEILLSANATDLYAAQAGLGMILLLGLTFSATGSFRQELETGAFELLLVTPLRERQIIAGRVRGLWSQFLPAIVLYGAGSIYLASGWSDQAFADDAWLSLTRTIVSFCTVPLVGLYFSVQRWNFFVAWLAACLIGLLPVSLWRAFGEKDRWMIGVQICVALTAAVLLHKRLRNREFLQKRT